MTGLALAVIFVLMLRFAENSDVSKPRAEITVKINCSEWKTPEDAPCFLTGLCTTNISVCFSRQPNASLQHCPKDPKFSKQILLCKDKKARSENAEVYRFVNKVYSVKTDLHFNAFGKVSGSFGSGGKKFNASLQILPGLTASSGESWTLKTPESVKDFLRVSVRLKCIAPFHGEHCEQGDSCLDKKCTNGKVCQEINSMPYCHCPPGKTGSSCNQLAINADESGGYDSSNLINKAIIGVIVAVVFFACVLLLACWCKRQRKRNRRRNDSPKQDSADENPIDVYDTPYDIIDEDDPSNTSAEWNPRRSLKGADHHDAKGTVDTVETTIEEAPRLPPRRLSTSSSSSSSRGEECEIQP